MSDPQFDKTKITKSIPPKPLPADVIQSLEQQERIESADIWMEHGHNGQRLVFQFMLKLDGRYHPLVLDDDGGGWVSLGSFEEWSTATIEFQAFNEEIGIPQFDE